MTKLMQARVKVNLQLYLLAPASAGKAAMMSGGAEYLATLTLVALDSLDTVHILKIHPPLSCRGQILFDDGRQTLGSESPHYHHLVLVNRYITPLLTVATAILDMSSNGQTTT